MALTNQEAQALLEPIIKSLDEAFLGTKDLDKVMEFYDPAAVLVTAVKGAAYGTQAIRTELSDLIGNEHPTNIYDRMYGGANDYLIYTGKYESTLPIGKVTGDFEQLWKRNKDGKYLVVYDRYSLNH